MSANKTINNANLRLLFTVFASYIITLCSVCSLAYWSTFGIDMANYVDSWHFLSVSVGVVAVCILGIIVVSIVIIGDEAASLLTNQDLPKPKIDMVWNKVLFRFNLFFSKYDIFFSIAAFVLSLQLSNTDYYNKWNYILLMIGICFYGYFHVYLFPLANKFFGAKYYVCYLCGVLIFFSVALVKDKAQKIYYNIDFKYFEPENDIANKYFNGESSLKYIGKIGDVELTRFRGQIIL